MGSFLGFGRGADYADPAWTSTQIFEIDGIVASGLRQFYFPPLLPGESGTYLWSFLKPTATLTLPVNAKTIPLPDDFGGFEGEIAVSSTNGIQWFPLKVYNEGMVYEEYARMPQRTGRPLLAAQQAVKGTTATQGQRWQLFVYPLPDAAYTLQFEYFILPDYLSTPFPYAYGGAEHAETILESCLAVAELRLDDALGPHNQQWLSRLAASIGQDRKKKPQSLGYNGDDSDQRWNRYRHGLTTPILFNGVQY